MIVMSKVRFGTKVIISSIYAAPTCLLLFLSTTLPPPPSLRIRSDEVVPHFRRPRGQRWVMFDTEPPCRKHNHSMLDLPKLKGEQKKILGFLLQIPHIQFVDSFSLNLVRSSKAICVFDPTIHVLPIF